MPHLESATVGVWVGAGARNETEHTNGIAHMLEHMAFKGTARRTARGIAEEIERVGGFINAYTARLSPTVVANLLAELMHGRGGDITAGEVGLPIQRDGKILPCGIYGRWEQ